MTAIEGQHLTSGFGLDRSDTSEQVDLEPHPHYNYKRMMSSFNLPLWLLAAPGNPVLAVGLPLALGTLSGFPTYKLTKEGWYNVQPLSGFEKYPSDD